MGCNECGMAYSFVFGVQFHKAECAAAEVEAKVKLACGQCGDDEEWCPTNSKE